MDKKTLYIIILFSLIFLGCRQKKEERAYFFSEWPAVCEYSFNDISKFVITCRVWGVMKYFHPNITAGMVDWDEVLLKNLDKIRGLLKTQQ